MITTTVHNQSLSPAEVAARYAKPVPRYTSYPTVPYWNNTPYKRERWMDLVSASANAGVSVYIHLPFCEKLCTYCGCNKRITKRHAVEGPYVDALLAEWEMYRQALPAGTVIQQLHFGGGTPTFFGADQLQRLTSKLLKGFTVPSRRDFSVEIHPAVTNRDQLARLADNGFNRVSIGVQDVDQEVLTLINRPQTIEQIANTVQWSRNLGYKSVNFDFVYGLPKQGKTQIENNLNLTNQLRPDRIAHYGYAHVPWQSPGQRAYDESHLPSATNKWALREQADRGLAALGYERIGFDHYALPTDRMARAARSGKLSRNFMGYTTHKSSALIGLGCSAISAVGGAFAQNHKVVEDYSKLALAGELPHVRGHQPKGRDLEIARSIRNLLCKGKTQLPKFDLGYTLPVLERLIPSMKEGLVEIKGLEVQLTAVGKTLSRHVALAFDEHYWKKRPGGKVFSSGV